MSKMYIYQLREDDTSLSYDEALAAICMQGLANRDCAQIYITCADDEEHRQGQPSKNGIFGAITSRKRATPWFWLDVMSEEGRWLEKYEKVQLNSIDELFEVTKQYINGIVIWDTNVPATVNAATTVAGVENLIAMSEEYYNSFGKKTGLPIKVDLRNKFDGHISGNIKVDVYEWAYEKYLEKGLCSLRVVGNFNDSWKLRDKGSTAYVLERDRFVCEKAFCFELSPWEYFNTDDEPETAPLGLEKKMMLKIFNCIYEQANGEHMTEFCGFFNAPKLIKGQENGVLSEWEQVYLMTPYNFYQNTVTNDVYNQSFHMWAPFNQLEQGRPEEEKPLENKVYVCMQICDMDSTTPLYDTMVGLWHDPRRGERPLAWGLNPNLSGVFPDLFEYFYETRSDNDYFCADASAAGYFNPSEVPMKNWDTVSEHCKFWYDHTDMTISGMVLDGNHPTKEVLSRFAEFSPDGFSSLISNFHGGFNVRPARQIYDGMPLTHMTIGVCDWIESAQKTAEALTKCYFSKMSPKIPEFMYYRLCYRNPSDMFDLFDEIQKQNPDLDIEMVDPYTYFDLIKQDCYSRNGIDPMVGHSK